MKKKSTTRTQVRAMQREREREFEKSVAAMLRMPKFLRQYFGRLGSKPSDVSRAYARNQVGTL